MGKLPFPLEKMYAHWVSSNTVIAPATSMGIYGNGIMMAM